MRHNRLRRWLHGVWERLLDNKPQVQRSMRAVRALPSLEQLEDRLTPAVLSDSGGILAIALGANENLGIVANASTYTFSSNQTFTNGGVSNPAVDFSAFG